MPRLKTPHTCPVAPSALILPIYHVDAGHGSAVRVVSVPTSLRVMVLFQHGTSLEASAK